MDRARIDRLWVGAYRPACAVCGLSDRWHFLAQGVEEDPTRLVFGAVWPDGTPVEDFSFTAFAVVCSKCGNVRLISADVLDNKVDSDPDGETEPH
ncbi:MAG TPA: hypothetical protein VF002_04985 [Gaiellaceae bacterium]